jgi:hypothetical protein
MHTVLRALALLSAAILAPASRAAAKPTFNTITATAALIGRGHFARGTAGSRRTPLRHAPLR